MFQLASDAFAHGDLAFGQLAALKWAAGFKIPQAHVRRDEEDFARCGHNLTTFAARRQATLAKNRLSVARVESLHPTNPERHKLLELADGMVVPTPPTFQPNGSAKWPALRPGYKQVAAAVDKCFFEHFVQKGLALLLSVETVRRWIPDIHLSVASWTTKTGKECGRPLTDCSFGASPTRAVLNGMETRALCKAQWGPIEHPSIGTFVRMILSKQEEPAHTHGKGLVLWASDIASAYTKLFFHPETVRLMAVELLCGVVIVFLAGIFGWTGTPYAFDVVTRALLHELRLVLGPAVCFYVDDMTGVCAQGDEQHALATTEACAANLLGPGALETKKNRTGRRIDVIGYTLDLDTQRVTIAPKNVFKTIYGFFLPLDRPGHVSILTLEKLSSWSSRYALVCVGLRPFVSHLYAAQIGRQRHVDVALTPTLLFVIQLFQALLTLSFVEEREFSRSFASFSDTPVNPTCIIEFDASLTGGGGLIFAVNGGQEYLIGGFTLNFVPLEIRGQPAFQNCAEFLAAMLALRIAHRAGVDVSAILFRGDSITALEWLDGQHFRSTKVSLAAALFVFMLAQYRVTSVQTRHLPKAVNTRADDLSRDVPWRVVQEAHPELSNGVLLEADAHELILLCNPRLIWLSPDALFERWVLLSQRI